LAASRLILDAQHTTMRVFYDMDTPITLAALEQHGLAVPDGAHYLTPDLIQHFDLYLSFSGGPILDALQQRWGARRVAPLYGSVDPDVHAPIHNPPEAFQCALGYLGTYAADRQPTLERLLIEPARRRPAERFAVAGSMYPASVDWPPNVGVRWHLDAAEHPAFYSGSRLTLNVTRAQMREWGYTPSGRIFEAAACGTPVLSDRWPGIDVLFSPGNDILVADTPDDVEAALSLTATELAHVAAAARDRVLAHHTGAARARELVETCEQVAC
jgi:spore maturation protein CgeB